MEQPPFLHLFSGLSLFLARAGPSYGSLTCICGVWAIWLFDDREEIGSVFLDFDTEGFRNGVRMGFHCTFVYRFLETGGGGLDWVGFITNRSF